MASVYLDEHMTHLDQLLSDPTLVLGGQGVLCSPPSVLRQTHRHSSQVSGCRSVDVSENSSFLEQQEGSKLTPE